MKSNKQTGLNLFNNLGDYIENVDHATINRLVEQLPSRKESFVGIASDRLSSDFKYQPFLSITSDLWVVFGLSIRHGDIISVNLENWSDVKFILNLFLNKNFIEATLWASKKDAQLLPEDKIKICY